jgi:hypothetical protein
MTWPWYHITVYDSWFGIWKVPGANLDPDIGSVECSCVWCCSIFICKFCHGPLFSRPSQFNTHKLLQGNLLYIESCTQRRYIDRAAVSFYRVPDLLRGRLQWPRGLRHEQFSLAGTLGSWVRMPFKAWMSVLYAFILFVQVAALRRAYPPSKESRRLCIGSRKWKSGQGPTKDCRPIIIIIII